MDENGFFIVYVEDTHMFKLLGYGVLAVILLTVVGVFLNKSDADKAAGNPEEKAFVIAESSYTAYTTGYSWWDNTPPGGAISDGANSGRTPHGVHTVAGGDGSYTWPVTMAVGHSITNGVDTLDIPAGTRFYIPNLRKYFIVEDTCGDGPTPQNGPCHINEDFPGVQMLDLWINGKADTASGHTKSYACMDAITKKVTVIKNPVTNYKVVAGSVYADKCATQYGNTPIKN